MALIDKLTAIGNAIRSKTKKTGSLTLDEMVTEIQSIETDPNYETPSIEVSTNGLITASANGKSNTRQLSTQAGKTVTPTKAEQTAVSSGKYTTGIVKVGAIPNEYIVPSGSQDIVSNDTYDVTGLEQVIVNVPIPEPTYDTPTIDVSTGGLITASANGKSNTKQLTTQASKTVTPTKSTQTAVASGRYTTGAVSVGAIPSEYIIPSGSETKTANGTYDVTSLAQLIVNVSGSGGLPTGASALDFGQITVASDFTTSRQTFNHKLGVTPDIVMVWAPANVATTYSMLFAIRGTQVNWRGGNYSGHMAYHGNSTTTVTWTNANSTSYGVSNLTATTFQLASSSSSYYWRKGNYNYIAIKFS